MDIKLFLITFIFASLITVFFFFRETRKEMILAFIISLAWTSFYPYEYTNGENYQGDRKTKPELES